jgi:peptide/nickel transport system substrate-binding protein
VKLRRIRNWKYQSKKIKIFDDELSSFSLTGKLIFYGLFVVFAISAVTMLWKINRAFLVDVPRRGGSLTEGVVGLPRYVNPLLAVTDGDKDLAALVYSGLMRYDAHGVLIPDLAENYSISDNGREYTLNLKNNIFFHDGQPITADDVEFTISKIQDPALKSVEYQNWEGILVKKTGDRQVKFYLRQPYAPFLENLTIGILPKHIWKDISPDAFPVSPENTNPVGSGQYKIDSIKKDASGAPSAYSLVPFKKYPGGGPLIANLTISFYPSEEQLVGAYESGTIDSMNGISPDIASRLKDKNVPISTTALPRTFAVFVNQSSNEALADKTVRQALNMTADRSHLVSTVLQGFGTPLIEPVPEAFTGLKPVMFSTSTQDELVTRANTLLEKNGWKLNPDGIREKKNKKGTTTLEFTITTSDASELHEVAVILQEQWKRIGAKVTIKAWDSGYLSQNVIRPRKYEALLFGQVVNRDLDLYAFWHSSQRDDPGLNIANYANDKVDNALQEMRASTDKQIVLKDYDTLRTALASDIPAIFLYSPNFIYVAPRQVNNLTLGPITAPSERLNTIGSWYIDTDKIWKVFVHNN